MAKLTVSQAVNADLVAIIESIGSLETLSEDTVQEIAAYMLGYTRDVATRGVDPYTNQPWQTKKDGTRALPDAASAVSVKAFKKSVELRLMGGEAFHQKGSTRDHVKRRILPDNNGLPPRMASGIAEILSRAVSRKLGAPNE